MIHQSLEKYLSRCRPANARPGRLALLAASFLPLTLHGCADSHCVINGDCPDDKVCIEAKCAVPECAIDVQCGARQLCERHFCVAGCAGQQECDDGTLCAQSRCRLVDARCGCPLAPELCAQDFNPDSPSAGQQVCVGADAASHTHGVGLFFGSLKCSICRSLFARLLGVREQMGAGAERPPLIFVHLKDVPISAAQVEGSLAEITAAGVSDSPVLLDSNSLRIWELFAADWYDFAIVSAAGCFSRKYVRTELAEDYLAEVQQTWTAAANQQCGTAAE